MKIVSATEMREIDRITTERFGVPSLVLMENAGTAVAEFVLSEYAAAQRVGVICGKGNNGGDGLVVARKLREAGREVLLLLLADPAELRGDAAAMFEKLPVKPFIVRSEADLTGEQARAVLRADVLIDAVLGTGFRPPVQELYAAAIRAMNASSAPMVAVDIPSGANSDAMQTGDELRARADAVVTFTAPKPAHVFADITPGPVLIAQIGSPEEAVVSSLGLNVITVHDLAALIGARPRDANKGNFGHVLVIGGSLGKAGAAAMAGMSALRAGAGLSTVATARSVLPTVASFHPELMTEPLDETEAGTISLRALEYGRFDHLMLGKTVLAIGPGISRNAETSELARSVVSKYQLPAVIDADGLNAFEGHGRQLNGRDRALVITPHPGEMARLTGLSTAEVQNDRVQVARTFARDHELIVVLKGHRTLIAHPDGTVWVNTTGNPGMATGGTGDILTGMVAGLVAQHPKDIFEAVLAAVYLHGLAGDIARESMGEHSLVATDLLKSLPEAFRRTRKGAGQKVAKVSG
jgi:ADP-dependent NAD(P)H-hydrate dehydratase / NAD(P)H-hydrate epimerase